MDGFASPWAILPDPKKLRIYITQGCNKTLCFYITFFRLQLAALSGLYKAILVQTIMSASKVNMQFVRYK